MRCYAATNEALKREIITPAHDLWKRDVVIALGQDLKTEHTRYSYQKQLLADEHKVVWYVVLLLSPYVLHSVTFEMEGFRKC